MHARLWNEPLQVSESVAYAEFKWKYYTFLEMKTGGAGPKIFIFNYWNDLALLGSV